MSKPINIAVLSTAHIHSKGFIENLAKGSDGRKPYAIWDDVQDRGQRYSAGCGAKFVPNIADVLKDPQVDGFMICAENTRHLPLLEQALPVGKPVMCEKPLCTTSADAATVRALQAKARTPLICGYFQPFGGQMRAIAAKIADGTFGDITAVRFRNAHHAAYGRWFDNPDVQWFTDPALAGGGALMDMGAHAVHLLRWLFGPVEAVSAVIANRCGIYPEVDDHGLALLRFAPRGGKPGPIGTVEASWIHQGGFGGLEIQGTKAALWHDGKDYVIGAPGQPATPVAAIEARPATADRLIAVIQGKIPADELQSDLDAILDEVAIMEAAYQSNAKGGWIPVAGAVGAAKRG
jgi:predicted dehydrogenase